RPASGSTPASPAAADTSSPGVPSPVPPATVLPPTPRCPRTSGHPLPARLGWPCSAGRHNSARPRDTPYRTADRTSSWELPSLSHAVPSAVSQPFLEVTGSSPITRLSPLSTLALNQGPFPPPALPGFVGTMNLSDSPVGRASPSRAAR